MQLNLALYFAASVHIYNVVYIIQARYDALSVNNGHGSDFAYNTVRMERRIMPNIKPVG